MKTWSGWKMALMLVAACFGELCFAQEEPRAVGEDSYAACLTPAKAERGSPEYPPRQLFSKTGGEVHVALTFTSKDSGPRVRLLNPNQWNEDAQDGFFRSIARFVSVYRLPCFQSGSVDVLQTFSFSLESHTVQPLDAKDTPSAMEKSVCKFDYVGQKPVYPSGSQQPYGNVVLGLKFNQRDEAPVVTVIYGGGHYLLAETAKSWAADYRLRCATPLEKPVDSKYTNRFVPPVGLPMALKDMDFISFLRSTNRKSIGKPKFDFNSMTCPFDVNVTLLQPYAPNTVDEASTQDKNRNEFLAWMKTLVFNYPPEFERFLVGQSTRITVPCMSLDLS